MEEEIEELKEIMAKARAKADSDQVFALDHAAEINIITKYGTEGHPVGHYLQLKLNNGVAYCWNIEENTWTK